ncbi:MAG: hypothetical protein EA361_15445 [Bacteroidetes bacterium]|nr:MAG: hypothetical protein EA361_15445 [Bacteroidota bacterium]
METNRREFLKTMGIATLCACTGAAGFNSCSMIKGVSKTTPIPSEAITHNGNFLMIDLEQSAFLQITGRAGKISLEDEDQTKIIVVHHSPGQYKAFSDRCTHGGRELNYLHEKEQLQCSSFGHSAFKLTNGHVIKGPAEGPLAIYPTSKSGNILNVQIS